MYSNVAVKVGPMHIWTPLPESEGIRTQGAPQERCRWRARCINAVDEDRCGRYVAAAITMNYKMPVIKCTRLLNYHSVMGKVVHTRNLYIC